MIKTIWTGIGFLIIAMNVNAAELAVDANSGIYSVGAGLVLGLSGIDYTYPATAIKTGRTDAGSREDSDAVRDFDADSTTAARTENSARFRLTAGVLESNPGEYPVAGFQNEIGIDATSGTIISNTDFAAATGKSFPYGNAERSASRDTRFKFAVGVGTTALEPEFDHDSGSTTGGLGGAGQADLATLLNEDETETVVDLENFFDRPVLAIGVNYAF